MAAVLVACAEPHETPSTSQADITSGCEPAYELPTWSPADDSVGLQSLLSASGLSGPSNWIDMAAGNVCGSEAQVVVLQADTSPEIAILRGRTPYVKRSGDFVTTSSQWRALTIGQIDGIGKEELVAVRKLTESETPKWDVLIGKPNESSCSVPANAAYKLTVGNTGNSEWIDAAAGDFDGDGLDEIVLVKNQHEAFHFVQYSGGALHSYYNDNLAGLAHPWKGVAAGDVDHDGDDELIAVRHVSNGVDKTILVYDWTGSDWQEIASSTNGNNGNSNWVSVAAGDFDGDGKEAIVAAKNAHKRFIMYEYDGTSNLDIIASENLDSNPAAPWVAVAATNLYAGSGLFLDDSGADELVAIRDADGDFRTDVFVYGSQQHRTSRDTALANTKALFAIPPSSDSADIVDVMTDARANTYSWFLSSRATETYDNLVQFLIDTNDGLASPTPDCVDGKQIRVWVTLPAPDFACKGNACDYNSQDCCADGDTQRCVPKGTCESAALRNVQTCVPTDSPLTPWNELDYFAGTSGTERCSSYYAWASLLGRLAQDYPQLVAVGIDDFSRQPEFASDYFSPESVARIAVALHWQAPWLNLVPTVYYDDVYDAGRLEQDGLKAVDSILYYFRDEKNDGLACEDTACNVPDRARCADRCLADNYSETAPKCADATLGHLPEELEDMQALMPAGRQMQGGVYFTAHGACGQPSEFYDFAVLSAYLNNAAIAGATLYTTRALTSPTPPATCEGPLDHRMCIAQTLFDSGP